MLPPGPVIFFSRIACPGDLPEGLFYGATGGHFLAQVRIFYILYFTEPGSAFAVVIHGAGVEVERLAGTEGSYELIHIFAQDIEMFPLVSDLAGIFADVFGVFPGVVG